MDGGVGIPTIEAAAQVFILFNEFPTAKWGDRGLGTQEKWVEEGGRSPGDRHRLSHVFKRLILSLFTSF